ncbi:ankyrin repeat-containing domain protein [Fusarium solani]|uniref:Ankyrin repeat-containing domain protein n=1 Tax=Fusarium solani TaxID=169388 RepID=A0A9P9K7I6_FUSSL|nr:ankyrin repeat-containing domain protein [Fusarium solani]KAH7242879.1 ankyrin repeat-containing domain protein [Fusarium solani]
MNRFYSGDESDSLAGVVIVRTRNFMRNASDEQSPKEIGNDDDDDDDDDDEDGKEKEDYKAYSHFFGGDYRLGLEVVLGDENTDSVSYDVVAIYGMHSWSRNAWVRNPRGPQFESWLDTKFNNLPDHSRRVMLYGYDPGDRSGKTFTSQGVYEEAEALLCPRGVPNTGDQGVTQEKRRPIWFLSHDLGGLIVKAVRVFEQSMSTMGIPFERRFSLEQPNHWLTSQPSGVTHAFCDGPNQEWLSPEMLDHLYPALRQLLDQASPIYPHMKTEVIESFSELDDLIDSFDNQIIHLRCTHANTSTTAWVSERTRLYLQYKRDPSQPLLFSKFDESALWFLDELRDYLGRNESNFRLLIITTHGTKNDEAVAHALSRFAADTVTSIEYEHPKPQTPKIGQTASLLIQERPQFLWNDHYERIRDLLSNYEHDRDLYQLVIDWLKSAQEPFESETGLLTGPFVPEVVFATAMAEMPDDRMPWAQKLLSWVLTSVRPLQAVEFHWVSDILGFGEEAENKTRDPTDGGGTRHHVDNILNYFRGLLVVVHGEVRFRHPDTREWLLNQDDIEDKTACVGSASSLCHRVLPPHYRQTASDGDVVKGLFEGPSLFKRWIEAYNALLALFLKLHPDSRKPLPVAAHFGIEDLVRSQLAESQDGIETRGQALVEAARAGQLAVAELIIESFASSLSFDDEYLHQAVKAASFCDDPDVFRKMVQIIPKPPHAIPVRIAKHQVDQLTNEPEDSELGAQDAETHEKSSKDKDTDPQSGDKNQDSPHDPFHWLALAAAYGNVGSIKLLLDAGATWATPRTTPLLAANSPLAATTLLEKGASLDTRMLDENRMPVQILSQWGDFLLLQTILQYRDHREYYKGEPEGNPVILAAKFHNRKCLELLLQHGFNPSIPNPDGETALWWAINNGRTDMCRLLLEHGADPDLTPEGAVPPLIESVFANSLDMMRLLVDHTANIEKKEMPGKGWRRTPLHAAIDYGHSDRVEYLLKQGADPNVKKWTPLHGANKFPETAQLLVELGADLTILTRGLYTSLDITVFHGQRATSDVILSKAKVKFHLSLEGTRKAMVIAVDENYVDAIEAILEAGADVNTLDPSNENNKNESILFQTGLEARSEKQNTVLHCMTDRSPVASFRLVVNAGGKLDVVNNRGITPLQMAAHNGNEEVFRDDIRGQKKDIVELLLENGADPSVRAGLFGYSLNSACMCCPAEIVKLLLDKNASIDIQDPFGRKPTHIACYNSLEALTLLKAPDSGVDVKDNDGWTPLLWEARASTTQRQLHPTDPMTTDTVSFMLERGADPTIEGLGFSAPSPASQIAYYSGADDIGDLIVAKTGKAAPSAKRRGKRVANGFCVCCLLEIVGSYVLFDTCLDFQLCFKCSRSRSKFHPPHSFSDQGEEWDGNGNVEPEKPEKPEKPEEVPQTPVRVVNGDIPPAAPEEGSQSVRKTSMPSSPSNVDTEGVWSRFCGRQQASELSYGR